MLHPTLELLDLLLQVIVPTSWPTSRRGRSDLDGDCQTNVLCNASDLGLFETSLEPRACQSFAELRIFGAGDEFEFQVRARHLVIFIAGS